MEPSVDRTGKPNVPAGESPRQARASRRGFLGGLAVAGSLVTAPGLLAACGSTPSAPTASGKKLTGAVTLAVNTTPAALAAMNGVYAQYEKAYPGATVTSDPIAGTADQYIQKIQTMNLAGDVPDLWDMDATVSDYVNRGFPGPLDNLQAKDPIDLSIFPKTLVDAWRYKGHLYGITSSTSFTVLGYNADILDAAGVPPPPSNWGDASWTLDEYIKRAKAATKLDAAGHFQTIGSLGFGGLYLETVMYGADWLTPSGKSNMLSNAFISALEAIEAQVTKDKIQPTPSDLSSLTAAGDPFLGGKAAFTSVSGPALRSYLSGAKFKWNLAPLPKITSQPAFGWLLPQAHAIFNKSKNKDLAWQFVKWASTKSHEVAWADAFGRLPTTTAGVDAFGKSVKQQKPDLNLDVLTGLLGQWGRSNQTTTVRSVHFRQILAEVITPLQSELGNGSKTAAELAKAGDATLRQILAGGS